MIKLNKGILSIDHGYKFSDISKIVNDYKINNKDKEVISLGIGDVSIPICIPVIDAMHESVDDLSNMDTFKGYGMYYGLDSLKETILKNEYSLFNFTNDEIYISNGTKSDSTNILELFDMDSKILITDPMYPIYKDGALSLNRNVSVLKCVEPDFLSLPPKEKYDIIYICSPSNPTGVCYNYDKLEKWIEYANKNNSVILYDNVYYRFITSEDSVKSIYEIDGAKKCAIEFRSFSKHASFTGVRCSYYIIPKEIYDGINKYWKLRTINRFNGADYIAQKGAEAVYLDESKKIIDKNIKYYLENARILKDCFIKNGFEVVGGVDSPFMWVKTKNDMSSLDFFKFFLSELNIIIIPGIIFGTLGEKYFRASALGNRFDIIESTKRISDYYEKSN